MQGFGEALVGNFPGSALCAEIAKEPLQAPAQSLSSSTESLAEAVGSLPREVVKVTAYPSKSTKLVLPDQADVADGEAGCAIIFRSDSNGEDLEGYSSFLLVHAYACIASPCTTCTVVLTQPATCMSMLLVSR